MSDPAINEPRRILRRVQKHLSQTQLNLGTLRESIGLVDVVYHPTNTHPLLNYVTPRNNTAWIPAPEIKKGLDRLRDLKRAPRITYIEGLYPPLFAKAIRELNMVVEQETAILTYRIDEAQLAERKRIPVKLPVEFRMETADKQEHSVVWWYLWKKAGASSLVRSIEPLSIGRAAQDPDQGSQINLIFYEGKSPIGVARLTIHKNNAYIPALAMTQTARTQDKMTLLYRVVMDLAWQYDCTLVFTSEDVESDHQLCRDMGFIDSGSVVRYVERTDLQTPGKDRVDEEMAQSVFALRESKPSKTKDEPGAT